MYGLYSYTKQQQAKDVWENQEHDIYDWSVSLNCPFANGMFHGTISQCDLAPDRFTAWQNHGRHALCRAIRGWSMCHRASMHAYMLRITHVPKTLIHDFQLWVLSV